MMSRDKQALTLWTVAAYLCICAALVLVVLLGVWGAYQEVGLVRSTLLQGEINRVRAQAIRRVGHLESELEKQPDSTDLRALRDHPWLRQSWNDRIPDDSPLLYGAVVDASGTVAIHSNPSLEGNRLGRRWYERVVTGAGDDVVETRSRALSSGKRVFDVRIPIVVGNQEIGDYHEGLDMAWFDDLVAAKRTAILNRWGLVIGGILVVVLLAAVSLYSIATRTAALRQAVNTAHMRRVAEVGQLAAGLAHEIRNPLHAIRLNLHALSRAHGGQFSLSREEVAAITKESNEEIERVDRLMREMLGFTSPGEPREENIELGAELQATVNFMRQEMAAKQIQVDLKLPQRPVWVHMDPGRLRQILLHLLMNAKDAVAQKGAVEVDLKCKAGRAEIMVRDDGEGISEAERHRVFEPFYSTKEGGTGFGLALVKRFVDEARGSVTFESNGQGTEFRVQLPELIKLKQRA